MRACALFTSEAPCQGGASSGGSAFGWSGGYVPDQELGDSRCAPGWKLQLDRGMAHYARWCQVPKWQGAQPTVKADLAVSAGGCSWDWPRWAGAASDSTGDPVRTVCDGMDVPGGTSEFAQAPVTRALLEQ